MTPTGMTLYQWSHCPFCAKVRRAFDAMGLQYKVRDVGADQAEVYQLTGRRQVPAVRDALTGVTVLGSTAAIDYARRTYAPAAPVPAPPASHPAPAHLHGPQEAEGAATA